MDGISKGSVNLANVPQDIENGDLDNMNEQ